MKINYPKTQYHNFYVSRSIYVGDKGCGGYHEHNFIIEEIDTISLIYRTKENGNCYKVNALVIFNDQTSEMATFVVEEEDPFILFIKEYYPEVLYL